MLMAIVFSLSKQNFVPQKVRWLQRFNWMSKRKKNVSLKKAKMYLLAHSYSKMSCNNRDVISWN